MKEEGTYPPIPPTLTFNRQGYLGQIPKQLTLNPTIVSNPDGEKTNSPYLKYLYDLGGIHNNFNNLEEPLSIKKDLRDQY